MHRQISPQSEDGNCNTTPLLVEIFLPTVGEAVQACFELDSSHQAEVFAEIRALLEKAASCCNGKLSQGDVAVKELTKLQETASQDMAFLQDQFKLVDEWKAKAHEAGVKLGKMRESYTKELTNLRTQMYNQNKSAEVWEPSDVVMFNVDDFLLSTEVAKRISESQLSSCKSKMILMQVENCQNLSLIERMSQNIGYASEQDVRNEFSGDDESFAMAEQMITLELDRFRQDALRMFRMKLMQCSSKPSEQHIPLSPTIPGGRQRRQSVPNTRQIAATSMRRKSDPAVTGDLRSLSLEPDSESSDSDDEGVVGLKARFEAKLKGKNRFESSKTLNKAKDKFLAAGRKPKQLTSSAAILKASTNSKPCFDRSVQTEAADEISYSSESAKQDEPAPLILEDKAVNTEAPSMRDRGCHPILADEFTSNSMLNDADMCIDAMLKDAGDNSTSFLSPRRFHSDRGVSSKVTPIVTGTNLPRVGLPTNKDIGSKGGASSSKVTDILARAHASAAGARDVSIPYTSPFMHQESGGSAASDCPSSPLLKPQTKQTAAESSQPLPSIHCTQLEPIDVNGGLPALSLSEGNVAEEVTDATSPRSPASPKRASNGRRRSSGPSNKNKFATTPAG